MGTSSYGRRSTVVVSAAAFARAVPVIGSRGAGGRERCVAPRMLELCRRCANRMVVAQGVDAGSAVVTLATAGGERASHCTARVRWFARLVRGAEALALPRTPRLR